MQGVASVRARREGDISRLNNSPSATITVSATGGTSAINITASLLAQSVQHWTTRKPLEGTGYKGTREWSLEHVVTDESL